MRTVFTFASGGFMRLFIGIWPDDAAVRALSAWTHDAQALCGGRIMQRQDMHLTVAFLGHVDADQRDALIHAVERWPVKLEPFQLERFGRFDRARIVWAGPSESDPMAWLRALYDTLWDRLADMGWHRSDVPFTPHVSLLRSAGPGDLTVLQREPVLCRPQRCVLVGSRPDGRSSNYQVLAHLPVI